MPVKCLLFSTESYPGLTPEPFTRRLTVLTSQYKSEEKWERIQNTRAVEVVTELLLFFFFLPNFSNDFLKVYSSNHISLMFLCLNAFVGKKETEFFVVGVSFKEAQSSRAPLSRSLQCSNPVLSWSHFFLLELKS